MRLLRRVRRMLLAGGLRALPGNLVEILGQAVGALTPLGPALARSATAHERSQLLVPRYLFRPETGMTTPNEQAYFEWYARQLYTGRGAIVDLGCWLGSTTIPLARGLRANPTVGTIHAYDQFVWERWMAGTGAGASIDPQPRPGESFEAAFRRRIAPWSELVVTHAADLTTEAWHGGTIEFLLVDAMKSWELSDAISGAFYPSLLPGGYLLHQDFAHYYTPWVHLVTHRLRDYLAPAFHVPRSASAVFRVVRALPEEVTGVRYADEKFTRGEIDAAYQWAMHFASADMHPALIGAKAKALVLYDSRSAAEAELAPWLARHPNHDELRKAAELVGT